MERKEKYCRNVWLVRKSSWHEECVLFLCHYFTICEFSMQGSINPFKTENFIELVHSLFWTTLRDHPFNLKGEGAMVFLGENFSVCKFDWKKNSVSEMGRKKYSVFVEKNNVAKKIFYCAAKRRKKNWLRKKPIAPPPLS